MYIGLSSAKQSKAKQSNNNNNKNRATQSVQVAFPRRVQIAYKFIIFAYLMSYGLWPTYSEIKVKLYFDTMYLHIKFH